MDIDVTRLPAVVRQGSPDGPRLGTSGGGRLTILNHPENETGYALVEAGHPAGEPHIRDHLHTRHDETFVVLAGRYEVRLGDVIVLVQAGDCVYVPRGTPHTYRNAGPAPARVLNIISPPDGVQLLAELGALSGTTIDEALLREVHARHSAMLVSPLSSWSPAALNP